MSSTLTTSLNIGTSLYGGVIKEGCKSGIALDKWKTRGRGPGVWKTRGPGVCGKLGVWKTRGPTHFYSKVEFVFCFENGSYN